jgi:hypothetical protein
MLVIIIYKVKQPDYMGDGKLLSDSSELFSSGLVSLNISPIVKVGLFGYVRFEEFSIVDCDATRTIGSVLRDTNTLRIPAKIKRVALIM